MKPGRAEITASFASLKCSSVMPVEPENDSSPMELTRRFGVSRSTVSRKLRSLRQFGAFEIVYERVGPKQLVIYYRLKESAGTTR